MYKILIPIKNTNKAQQWCKEQFGTIPDEHWKLIRIGWRGSILVVDDSVARWSFRRNKKTSTWKFKNVDDAVFFKLMWYEN